MAALAEHLAFHDELEVPDWAYEDDRFLEQWWFPVELLSVRAEALVHSPGAFRIRGIFIGLGALDRAWPCRRRVSQLTQLGTRTGEADRATTSRRRRSSTTINCRRGCYS